MPEAVYRMRSLLCAVVVDVPVGTNLGLLHLCWMAVIPGLQETGLSEAAIRRAWAALGQGSWKIGPLLARWAVVVHDEGAWQPACYEGFHPVAVDVTAVWRPRLRGCPTSHDRAEAGKALPAIPIGIIARVGRAGGQRLGPPLGFVRAPADDPRPSRHLQALVAEAVRVSGPDDALVTDRGFGVALLQAAGARA